LDSTIPRYLSDVVMRCLEIDPQRRYASAAAIVADLEAHRRPRGSGFSRRMPRFRTVEEFPTKWIGPGLAAVLLLAAGVVFRAKIFGPVTKPTPTEPAISLAILPFRNASGDASLDWLGPELAELLDTDVGQSASVHTVASDRLGQILHDMRLTPNGPLDPSTLRRVGEISAAQTVVWGRYDRLGDQIRINATLQDFRRDVTTQLTAEAPNANAIPGAVDRLAREIRENLALPPSIVKELEAQAFKPSSKSLPALRHYNEGLELLRQGNNLESQKRFLASTQEDPEFALAYSKLARTYSNLGYANEAQQASRKAVGLSQSLSRQEKYRIAAEHAAITKDYAKAIAAYENLAKAAPEDPDVQFNLGGLYEDTGALDKAREFYSKVVKAEPKNADALLAMGRVEVKSGNLEGGLTDLNQALSLTIQLGNDEERAMVLQALGVDYQFLDKPNDALNYYQQSLEIKRRLGQKRGVAESLHAMAVVQDALGRSQDAAKSYQEALKLLREIDDTKGVGDALFGLSVFYLTRGQYDQGLQLAKQALQIERDSGDQNSVALCLNAVGGAYYSKGDYDNALIYYQQALQVREKLNVPSDIADTLHNLAELETTTGQYEEAERQYLRSLDLRRKADDKKGAAIDSNSLGTLFGYEGRYGAALNAKQEAVKTFQGLQERSSARAEVLSGYGEAQAEAGRSEEAQKSLGDALALARELKNESLAAQTLNAMGDNFFYRGDRNSAQARYQEALQAATLSKDRKLVLLSKINLARLALLQGRSREGVVVLKDLAEEADTLGEKYFSVDASIELAQGLIDVKNYPGARQELDRAFGRSEKMGLRTLQAKVHYLRATLLRLIGKGRDASAEYQEALKLLEQARSEPGADKVLDRADLNTIYTESTRWSKPGIT
jgi:eukaryotic-like serine/threonine-protein kinase